MLAACFVQALSLRLHVPVPALTATDIAALQQYDWPGNIRELQTLIERA